MSGTFWEMRSNPTRVCVTFPRNLSPCSQQNPRIPQFLLTQIFSSFLLLPVPLPPTSLLACESNFFLAWGFPSSLRPGSGLAPAWRRRLRTRARLLLQTTHSKEETGVVLTRQQKVGGISTNLSQHMPVESFLHTTLHTVFWSVSRGCLACGARHTGSTDSFSKRS